MIDVTSLEWLGLLPALLKAFLEQLFRPGFAFARSLTQGGKRLFDGRSARVVVTMGMPEAIDRQVAPYAYHVGQIVRLARHLAGDRWQSLSIPKRR
ncbi:MAG TPA: DUF1572 family protein [Gemmatimonadales bacterium]|nr:DUF1572 family protein [Gemmatimonadales bacterium]